MKPVLTASPTKSSIFTLYRSLLRQTRLLPHEYLRYHIIICALSSDFFRLKLSTDIKSALDVSRNNRQRQATFNRLRKELSKLKLANDGHKLAFAHVLDLAYGRKGPLKWGIMIPLLSSPAALVPPRIIPSVERSRPPVYSPELAALLSSPYTRPSGKAVKLSHLRETPTLPSRAYPSSDDARLFGSLSKRREVNIRWRYFSYQWKRLYPPIEVSVKCQGQEETSSQEAAVISARIRGVGMQTAGLLEELKTLAGAVSEGPPIPRRTDPIYRPHTSPAATHRRVLPNRYLRRRYRDLLSRIPTLTYSYVPGEPKTGSDGHPMGKYEVSLTPNALSRRVQHETAHSPEMDTVDLAWFERGNG
ncbi:hypothetical protein B0F90DRAFT_1620741 [Multifurca ochricompacta]|uniref:LYR motif-containing protein Cup1-like N-terminal domain-containing protein n=1 Tax=Multifurca ochricompacta TaxID=376703 RepID=A0AAD4MEZ6_9AGAM|nr:hypothetical protein B0F90DRAFT_1620741 [Multifurca ochricompacta]